MPFPITDDAVRGNLDKTRAQSLRVRSSFSRGVAQRVVFGCKTSGGQGLQLHRRALLTNRNANLLDGNGITIPVTVRVPHSYSVWARCFGCVKDSTVTVSLLVVNVMERLGARLRECGILADKHHASVCSSRGVVRGQHGLKEGHCARNDRVRVVRAQLPHSWQIIDGADCIVEIVCHAQVADRIQILQLATVLIHIDVSARYVLRLHRIR